jgi:histidinol-phosphate aminotransferase
MPFPDTKTLVRPLVHNLHAYVPGEQPAIPDLIKLNTNENPYPPSPEVLKAVKDAVDERLRLYPNPSAAGLREKLSKLHGCSPDNIVVGNGSDDVLALATRAFVEPVSVESAKAAPRRRVKPKSMVQYFWPSYSLYPVLADIHGAGKNAVPLKPDFAMPSVAEMRAGKKWRFDAALSLVTTPNAPSGRGYATSELEKLCKAMKGVVILDEAYADFADENAMELALKYPHVIVSRTFSKAYSLCFQRVGYFVGHRDLIDALHKVRDSYNVNGLGQIAASATLDDLDYYRRSFRKVIATRKRLSEKLAALGFEVLPSQTNFILCKPPKIQAQSWLGLLRVRKIIVRWFNQPETRDFLRITVGTDAEAAALLHAVKEILRACAKGKLNEVLRAANLSA